ncbi:MAG: hypothetical protein J5685_08350 [Clostridiales bacterium]|nr:hypothetical protein [Clostridiales bacterium]
MKVLRSAVTFLLAGAMMMSLAGCAKKIEPLKAKDFKDALENALDVDEDEYLEIDNDNVEVVMYSEGKYVMLYRQYDDEDDAADWFEDTLDDFEDAVDDKDFTGRHRQVYNENGGYGYILFNGENEGSGELMGDGHIYGGIYWAEDTIVYIFCASDKDKYIDGVNAVLRELGYPRP